MTAPGVDEHSSFDDGFAAYARFFYPYGITIRDDGSVIWIADAGNNKIRNISCTGIEAPTFDPTAAPTKRPSFVPTQLPTAKTKALVVTVVVSKAAKPVAPQVTKAPTKVKGASMSEISSSSSSGSSSMTSSQITIIAVIGFAVASVAIALIYNRNRITDAIFGYSVSGAAKAPSSEAAAVSTTEA